jgi:hypothetical protein
MKLRAVAILLAFPGYIIYAQTADVDCSRRTAEDYVAITRTERVADYVRSLTGAEPFLYAGSLAGFDQWKHHPKEWGEGALGYSRRFGDRMAASIIGNSFQHGFALALGEDNRYFYSGSHNVAERFGYALSSPFLARHASGHRTLSFSAIGGVAAGSLIQQAWQPRGTWPIRNAARSFALTFIFRAGFDAIKEFSPRALGRDAR